MNKELTVLTSEDKARFDELKEIVKAGLGNALRVGQALMEIKKRTQSWKFQFAKKNTTFHVIKFSTYSIL